jgi:hypothetical protein
MLVERAEHIEHTARCELQALERVKPNYLAREAEMQPDAARVVSFELARLHLRGASGAVDRVAHHGPPWPGSGQAV